MMASKATQKPELALLAALRDARAAAKTLVKSESQDVVRGGQTKDFYVVPSHEVKAEERRLTETFGLVLWTDTVSTERVDLDITINARFTLYHVETGASKVYEFAGLCFPLSENNNNAAWAIEATRQYVWRYAVYTIFDIQVEERPGSCSPSGRAAVLPSVGQKTAPTELRHLPYTPELLLNQLDLWSAHQRDLAVAGGEQELAHRLDITPLVEAWAACRMNAKNAGIRTRPHMPGDKPNGEHEHMELYHFLWAENGRDGLV
jgi:hypothetical protein